MNHQRLQRERALHIAQRRPGREGGSQTAITAMADDMADARFASRLQRAIRAAVVDHQRLDLVDAVDVSRQIGQRLRQSSSSLKHGV